MSKVKSKDITFVMQGPFAESGKFDSNKSIFSLRESFPESQIIVSTWVGQGLQFLGMDFLIESIDPGVPSVGESKVCSINRQLVSSYAGLKKVSTKYAVKIRSDCRLVSDKLMTTLGSLDEEKLVIIEYSSVHSVVGYHKLNYNLCDWFVAGNREGVEALFNRDLVSDDDLSYWCDRKKPWLHSLPECVELFQAEQYLWLPMAAKHQPCNLKHGFDFHFSDFVRFMNFASQTVTVLAPEDLSLESSKHPSLYQLDKTRLTQSDLDVWLAIRSCDLNALFKEHSALSRLIYSLILLFPKMFYKLVRTKLLS